MAWVNLNTIYATKSEVNSKVPNTRTINGKALSSNVTLGASDIKLSDDTTLQSAWDSISPTTPTLITGDGYAVHKVRRIVIVTISMNTSIEDAWGLKSIATLPSNYKPIKEHSCALAVQGGYDSSVIAKITYNCDIVVQGKATGWRSGWVFGSFAYISIA